MPATDDRQAGPSLTAFAPMPMTSPDSAATPSLVLPLFPLRTVLFPDGLLTLKVFETRYLDLIGDCLRNKQRFGVVCLTQGNELVDPAEPTAGKSRAPVSFERVGVTAEVLEADAVQANILQVRCRGMQRFIVRESRQQPDGLWRARVRLQPADAVVPPTEDFLDAARALASAIASLKQQGTLPFLMPFQFAQAGWVANRWCELLPIPVAARQKLMELPDPLARLQLVTDFLREKGVVS